MIYLVILLFLLLVILCISKAEQYNRLMVEARGETMRQKAALYRAIFDSLTTVLLIGLISLLFYVALSFVPDRYIVDYTPRKDYTVEEYVAP